MAHHQDEDWEHVKDITYAVVNEQKGKGMAYEETVAGTLGVKGLYMVILSYASSIDYEL